MNEQACDHEWIGSTTMSVPLTKWRSCRLCGVVEKTVIVTKPIWTAEKPTVPGYYRNRSGPEDDEPILVQITDLNGILVAEELSGVVRRIMGPVSGIDGEWQGPLEPTK